MIKPKIIPREKEEKWAKSMNLQRGVHNKPTMK